MKTKFPSNRKVQLAFGSAILALLVVGAFSYRGIVLSSESDRWLRHTHEVLATLHELGFAMETVESSSREFVLTGNESYLGTYRASRLIAEQDQEIVRNLTVDNPKQESQLSALEGLIAEEFALADLAITGRHAQGLEVAADVTRSGSGDRIMVEFLGISSKMQSEELRLLVLRNADAKRRLSQTKTVLIVGTVLGLLITVAAGWSVQRDGSERKQARSKLLSLTERLAVLHGCHECPSGGAAIHRGEFGARPGKAGIRAALPAQDQPENRKDYRRRSIDPVDTSHARAGLSSPIYPRGGRLRSYSADRQLGPS